MLCVELTSDHPSIPGRQPSAGDCGRKSTTPFGTGRQAAAASARGVKDIGRERDDWSIRSSIAAQHDWSIHSPVAAQYNRSVRSTIGRSIRSLQRRTIGRSVRQLQHSTIGPSVRPLQCSTVCRSVSPLQSSTIGPSVRPFQNSRCMRCTKCDREKQNMNTPVVRVSTVINIKAYKR